MVLAISLLCGIHDVHLVFLIFFMTGIGMLIGIERFLLLLCARTLSMTALLKYEALFFFLSHLRLLPIAGLGIEMIPCDKLDTTVESQNTLNERLWNIRNLLTFLGWLTIFVPWLVLLCYFFQSAKRIESDPGDEKMPDFVYIAVLGLLVLFISFGTASSSLFHPHPPPLPCLTLA